ncbi:hypothetical protein EDM52_19020 [Brevibacillus invocatus]|uniref:HNH endonuclease n=2 Tax=Brevibacillus invocatus TaxID=173959 RepID=A0A3M8C1M9_9BACL|nr:hypothetical protein EDM52_19020 [Brevibacillus invocatus]
MICKLCGNPNMDKPESHIVSKFFFDWLKRTSPTGFLREPQNSNKRLQDGLKLEFLCSNCEKVMGKWEKSFSEKIFKPLSNCNATFSFKCDDEYILKFGVSIVWRALEYNYGMNLISDMTEEELNDMQKALETWKDYLLDNSQGIGKNHVYIIPVKQFLDNGQPISIAYNRSVGIDFKVFDDQYWGFVFVKVPNMIIIGDVIGDPDSNMKKYQIYKQNTIKDEVLPIIPEVVVRVINNSIAHFEKGAENISQHQIEKIRYTYNKTSNK